MDKEIQPYEPLDHDEEEVHDVIEELDYEEVEPITRLPKYIPSWKGKANIPRDSDSRKFMVSTSLLPEKIPFEGTLLGCIPTLKMEDRDLVDHKKFPHLVTNKYLARIYYETRVI